MGGDDHGDADLIESFEQFHDFERQLGIKIASRFVRQQDVRLVDHGTGDADALLFATGKTDRKALFLAEQADALQRGTDPLGGFGALEAGNIQRQGDVFKHRAVEQQAVILKDKTDLAAVIGDLTRAQSLQALAIDDDLAAGLPLD